MKAQRYTFKEFNQQFPDDAACMEHIFDLRYPNRPSCAKCGRHNSFSRVTTRRAYSCICGHQIYPTEGTIFHKSSTSLKTWFHALFIMTASKNGVAAKEIERQTGVTYKTAWRMAKQIRKLMEGPTGQISGIVECDETFIGGLSKNMHRKKRREKITGTGGSNKISVVGIVERGGEVRAHVTENVRTESLIPALIANVERGSTVCTDEWCGYNAVQHVGYVHARINHSQGEYVRAEVHTNSIEGFWSQLKRSINGTFHHVSKKHLQGYVDEFAYRYNHRKLKESIFVPLSAKVAERRD